MTAGQITAVIAAIVLTGALVAFGPGAWDDYQQGQRDKGVDCALYRAGAAVDRLTTASGGRADHDRTERRRAAAGCS